MKVNDNLALPVAYTLRMKGDCTFEAEWNPAVKSSGLPLSIKTTSRTSGIRALERLYDLLLEYGVVKLT